MSRGLNLTGPVASQRSPPTLPRVSTGAQALAAALKISIIVPAFNEERLLQGTLRQVYQAAAAFSDRGWRTELVVCDNNSTDRTAEIARAAGAKVVFEEFNQIGRARNTGAGAASGDWLLFVDADSHPTRELFAAVGEQISSGCCLAGSSTVRFERHYRFAGLFVHLWNGFSRIFKLMAGSFIFCDRAAFRELGGFSLEHFVAEELELSRRLKQLARHRSKKIVILYKHPLLTSGRKIDLYTPLEHVRFLLKTAWTRGKNMASREECFTWYDGRR